MGLLDYKIPIPFISEGNGFGSAILGNTYVPNEFKESDDTTAVGKKKTEAEKAVTERGDYTWVGDEKLADYISQWEGRPDFSYDFNADALYQQYKDKYIKQGKMAMADTIGQASAMTGGYGNSYAQSVGQQAYQGQLEQLNDIVPELYQMAYDRYNQDGQDLLSTIGLLRGEREFDYGMWSDKTDRLIADRNYYGDEYGRLYDRDWGKYTFDENMGYNTHRDAVEDAQWAKNYDLSERELLMAEEAWKMEKDAINSTGGGSGNTGNNGNNNNKPKTTETDKYETKDYYADWDAVDWVNYFQSIRLSEGKAAAEKELNKFTSKGLIPQKYVGVATTGARGSSGGH